MILVGTSGYSYDDWRDGFYGSDIKRRDFLSFYARHFPTVELDFTYYRMPDARTLAGIERKTPEGFLFCVKLHSSMTHEIPAERAEMLTNERLFSEAVRPLVAAGKLGCLLAQFPWSFRRSAANVDYLRGLVERMRAPLVVEFRNREWAVAETYAELKEMGAGYCCVDEPALRGLMPRVTVATSRIGYVRFHGRNAAKWWDHEQPWERYDYLYSDEELSEWIPDLRRLGAETEMTFVLFNNCHAGKAARNAATMQTLLGLAQPATPGVSEQVKLF